MQRMLNSLRNVVDGMQMSGKLLHRYSTYILNGTMNSGAYVYILEYYLLLTVANSFGGDCFIFHQDDVNCDR